MIKDRDQKQQALRFAVANRWFPQLEVDVHPGRAVAEKAQMVTDLDVLASIPDEFSGYRSVVFDCKTKARESAVNRALWLSGVLNRIGAQQGFCILKKESLQLDHVLMANRLKVILLAEDEFDLYAQATCPSYKLDVGNIGLMDSWDAFFEIPSKFAKLTGSVAFVRSGFWMINDPSEACRRTLAVLKQHHPELDPKKPEHVAIFLDFCSLFTRALAVVVCEIFKSYLHPSNQNKLAEALLVTLYGGREAYQHRNDLFKLVLAKNPEQQVPDLALPEWDRFLNLFRQLLDAPLAVQRVPLILREVAFGVLRGDNAKTFAKTLCSESQQAARFAVLIPSYLCRAAKLPSDFEAIADQLLLSLIPTK